MTMTDVYIPENTRTSYNFSRALELENLMLSGRNLRIEPVSVETAVEMAELQGRDLYPGITPEDILDREAANFEPTIKEGRYRAFVLRDDEDVVSVGHLRLRHNYDSQNTDRIHHINGLYVLKSFSSTFETDAHEIEIGGAVVNPKYEGQGLGSLLMRSLTNLALEHPVVVSRTAKGRYNSDQMIRLKDMITERGFVGESEILDEGMSYLSRNREASTASVRMAEEFGMQYGGVSLTFGGPFYYLGER